MTNDDLQKIRVAAADKEDVEFELDRAELVLQEAVAEALVHGEDIAVVAELAELPVEDVAKLAAQDSLPRAPSCPSDGIRPGPDVPYRGGVLSRMTVSVGIAPGPAEAPVPSPSWAVPVASRRARRPTSSRGIRTVVSAGVMSRTVGMSS